MDTVVVVGSGQGGIQVAASLRRAGFVGAIDVIGAESEAPYERPPLSKGVLSGKTERDMVRLHPDGYYEDNGIILHLGTAAESIDRVHKAVSLSSGASLPYTHLVLATGAFPRQIPIPGNDLDGVLYLRDLAHTDDIKERLSGGPKNIVIVGGGFIGLETAATLSGLGHAVTVLETAGSLMPRVASEIVSNFFTRLHTDMGTALRLETAATEILGDRRASRVRTGVGEEITAELVLVGIGVIPETSLAERAGLDVDGGIVVNEHLCTSDPAIFAVGDCAYFPCLHAGGAHVRLESVQNATDQGRHVAAEILGEQSNYSAPPWFWTDQGTTKYQIAGIPGPHDQSVVLGSVADGKFSVLLFRGEELVCVESVGRAVDHINARRMMTMSHGLTAEMARQPGFQLKAYVNDLVNQQPIDRPLASR